MEEYAKGSVPCNPEASEEVRCVLDYLSRISGKQVITGQHTKTMEQKELQYIKEVTGKEPALVGFELLAYSPNINYEDAGRECLIEVEENRGTLERAYEAAEKKALITFTWHWFSPLYGRDKSFYADNTEYDADKAAEEGTKEQEAFFADMDYVAGLLQGFKEKKIPILWRPFHEAEGNWFWWGAKGCKTAAKLYRLMYERYTKVHHLDNLIWVWNCPLEEGYPGDDTVDIISRDIYSKAHVHTSMKEEYLELIKVTKLQKIAALAEVGTLPSIEKMIEDKTPWTYYMTWSGEFVSSEEFTKKEILAENYHSEYAVTLECLPKLY